MTKLLGLDYKIQYKKGTDNQVADALSRRHESTPLEEMGSCLAISSVKPGWIEELQNSYEGGSHCQDIVSQLILDSNSHADYTWLDGILRYQGRIYIGNANNIRNQIIQALHDSAIGGHSGQKNYWQKLKSLFYWPGMKQEVINYVQNCEVCQRNKSEHVPYPGLLQPIPIPKRAWLHITMDFIEKLPKSQGYD